MADAGPSAPPPDPQAVAEAAGRHFSTHDSGTAMIGALLAEIAPGRAVVRMTVTARHLNAAGVCHGGLIFALADSALGFASCSHGIQTLAQHADIHWLRPGLPGDTLTATATEVSRSGRSAVYDVAIANQSGDKVAAFRGLIRAMGVPVGAKLASKNA